jgi:hypothetical protein
VKKISINQEKKEPLKVNEYALNYLQMRRNEENLSLGMKLINSIFFCCVLYPLPTIIFS